jgi:hypothetical protein
VYPALVIGRETAGGDHAVDVRVMLEILSPGVEHTRNRSRLQDALGRRQSPVRLRCWRGTGDRRRLSCLQSQPRQLVGNRKDDMNVVDRQQFRLCSPASHLSRALVWHLGQCLERQELNEMASWPHCRQRSR